MSALEGDIAAFRAETRAEFAAVRQEVRAEFAAVRQEVREEFAAVRGELRDLRFEMRDGLDKLSAQVGALTRTLITAGFTLVAALATALVALVVTV